MKWISFFLTFIVILLGNLFGYSQENDTVLTPSNFQSFYNTETTTSNLLKFEIGTPSLSYLNKLPQHTFYLMEIDLTVDLRKQALQNKTPFLYESENPHIIEKFSVRLPSTGIDKTTIRGRNRLDFTVHRGPVRNSVYKDASFYTGAYNPFTSLPY